jgi:hypothetical protein
VSLDPATREDLIEAINRLCERLFGSPDEAPFAVDVDRYKDEWRIKFRNDLRDHTPGSFLIGRYNTIAVGSKDPDIQQRRFEFPVSANELVEAFLSQGTLSAGLPDRPPSWLERFFADTMDWLHHSDMDKSADAQPVVSPYGFQIERPRIGDEVIPKKTFRSILEYATDHQLSAIVSAEGASKTSTALDVMLDDCDNYRLFHPGFLVVACRSYEQAHRKCAEFNERTGPGKGSQASCYGHSTRFSGKLCRVFDRAPNVPPGMDTAARSRGSTRTQAMLGSRFSTIIGIRSSMSLAGAVIEAAVSTEQFATPRLYSRPTASYKTGFIPVEPAIGSILGLRNGCRHETISITPQSG